MTRFFTYAAIVIGLGATATLAISTRAVQPNINAEAAFATDGPFRDGLFLGKLAAENGLVQRPPIGRWSTERDRAMFSAGYRRGFQEARQ
jgi:hypothetical protein